ncbi:MAG: hypothetical protein IT495_03625 [Gammaproteobacteria bacterium]|nr:hypothetical protein [Gammaproteobacteria bacterium]
MQVCGWDIGGAHLKLARADAHGRLLDVQQIPCPLWRGLEHLRRSLAQLAPMAVDTPSRHVVTMTGELVDLFDDRTEGVRQIVATLVECFDGAPLAIFAGREGLIGPADVAGREAAVASANWLAAARWAARGAPAGLLMDVGSTTTDLVAFAGGAVHARGYTDAERLRAGELIYTGVVRTPVAAVLRRVPLDGEWTATVAEFFASLGDVYVLADGLVLDARFGPGADERGFDTADCVRRLARMVGADAGDRPLAQWRSLARFIAATHEDGLRRSVERSLSGLATRPPMLLGAGVGRFLVRRIASRLGLEYVDFATLVPGAADVAGRAAECAPAAALTQLVVD